MEGLQRKSGDYGSINNHDENISAAVKGHAAAPQLRGSSNARFLQGMKIDVEQERFAYRSLWKRVHRIKSGFWTLPRRKNLAIATSTVAILSWGVTLLASGLQIFGPNSPNAGGVAKVSRISALILTTLTSVFWQWLQNGEEQQRRDVREFEDNFNQSLKVKALRDADKDQCRTAACMQAFRRVDKRIQSLMPESLFNPLIGLLAKYKESSERWMAACHALRENADPIELRKLSPDLTYPLDEDPKNHYTNLARFIIYVVTGKTRAPLEGLSNEIDV